MVIHRREELLERESDSTLIAVGDINQINVGTNLTDRKKTFGIFLQEVKQCNKRNISIILTLIDRMASSASEDDKSG